MQILYKNKRLEKVLIGANVLMAAVVTASYVCLFGFDEPLLPRRILYAVQVVLLFAFIAEKIVRLFNAQSAAEFFRANWYEIPLALALGVAVFGAPPLGGAGRVVRHVAVGVYLVLQVVIKVCRTVVNLAASGRSPTQTLIASFLVLIISGAGLLMLPRASATENINFVDALFTATSATCVTGLIVRDTGSDFSLMGQLIILSLIQLGGLGIVVFGAVFALLLGQALSLRERVAMQDLLSARTLGRISNMIAFIFVGTLLIEAVGAVSIFRMWDDAPGWIGNVHQQWFCSIFHSISAFCNAGFSLFSDSFAGYNRSWGVYAVICPLIVLGGLGFGVLYDLVNIVADRIKRLFKRLFNKQYRFSMGAPIRMQLQTKIVLSVSFFLIVFGTLAILLFERYAGPVRSEIPKPSALSTPLEASRQVGSGLLTGSTAGTSNGPRSSEERDGAGWSPAPARGEGLLCALFQSITARTTGFNTVDISAMSASSKFILILLMFIGGSPGSTAGGIKTVTLAVVVMTAIAALRKRQEVEMFKRSIRIVVVGRAITVTLLFVAVLFVATLVLSITENANGFDMSQIMFEAGSALGTVGLTTGITPSLTTAGKLIIIAVMLIGRLGPLTLLAALTFNLKPARYDYPQEVVIVG